MDKSTEIGPLAREDIYNNLQTQIKNIPKSWKISWKREDVQKPFFSMTGIEGTDEIYDHEMFCSKLKVKIMQFISQILAHMVLEHQFGVKIKRRSDQQNQVWNVFRECPSTNQSYPADGVGRSGFGRQCGIEGLKAFANINTFYVS